MIDDPTTNARGAVTFEVRLDAGEPYLDDHRPGGRPLLGTAMSLELMVRALGRTGALPGGPLRFDDVAVGAPLVIDGPTATTALIVAPSPTRRGAWWCAATTNSAPHPIVHVGADLSASPQPPERRGSGPIVHGHGPAVHAVAAGDVYELFFHGPAFRVIERATAEPADRLVAVLAPPRPLEHGSTAAVSAAYLIEACMQTAGLLEVATSARMMIPHTIGRIVWSRVSDPPAPLTAIATRCADGAIDVDLADAAGTVHLTLRSYRTVTLPFPLPPEPIEQLREALRQTIS